MQDSTIDDIYLYICYPSELMRLNLVGAGMANVVPLLVCLLLALCTLSLSADHLLVSIDCGSSAATYKDEKGIAWTGDDEYVRGGESRLVQVPFNSSGSGSGSHVMATLRVFNNTKTSKSCYTINSVKPGRVLLRASFHYGNYDGKNSPPTFDLLFDGIYWDTVNMSADPAGTRKEVIYVRSKESISVCVAQSYPDQFPFISALEIRSLEASMYTAVKDNVQLYTTRRVAFGANQPIRFPEDPYDRIWDGILSPAKGLIQVSGDAVLSSGLTKDNPPPAVLKTAITNSSTPNTTINLYMGGGSNSFSFYINMYFSEVTRLNPNQTRSLYVYKDNRPFSTTPVVPPYGNCTQFFATNVTILPNTTFSLVPTNDSTLLPLINAMEVFLLYQPEYDATNKKDVQGLASLQEAFSSLQDWSGDPCLPSTKYAWNWVKCNYDEAEPRVTTLLLGGYRLSGLLPDFSSMDALQTISLPNNSLRGNIPDFLGTFPNLQVLNLENNQFTGTIPASLSTKKGLVLRVSSGNPGLCASNTSCSVSAPPSKPNSSARKKKILEILFAAIIPSIIVLQLS